VELVELNSPIVRWPKGSYGIVLPKVEYVLELARNRTAGCSESDHGWLATVTSPNRFAASYDALQEIAGAVVDDVLVGIPLFELVTLPAKS
jgi:hypothetical protein